MEAVLGLQELKRGARGVRRPATRSCTSTSTGRDPDDGMTRVPYEKGALFLTTLEKAVRPRGVRRLPQGLLRPLRVPEHHHRRLRRVPPANLLATNPEAARTIDLHAWLEEPGLPPTPRAEVGRGSRPSSAAARDLARAASRRPRSSTTADWSTQEWLRFLQVAARDARRRPLAELDARVRPDGAGQRRDRRSSGSLIAIRNDMRPPTPGSKRS